MSVWSGEEVSRFCEKVAKINPNGIDLTPLAVFQIPEENVVIICGEDRGFLVDEWVVKHTERKIEIRPITRFGRKIYFLEKGIYEIRLPRIEIPENATGFCYPRSSFARLGVIKSQTAVFDSGYKGEGSQTFFFPGTAIIGVDEAWVQMVFIDNKDAVKKGYEGKYQGETADGK